MEGRDLSTDTKQSIQLSTNLVINIPRFLNFFPLNRSYLCYDAWDLCDLCLYPASCHFRSSFYRDAFGIFATLSRFFSFHDLRDDFRGKVSGETFQKYSLTVLLFSFFFFNISTKRVSNLILYSIVFCTIVVR